MVLRSALLRAKCLSGCRALGTGNNGRGVRYSVGTVRACSFKGLRLTCVIVRFYVFPVQLCVVLREWCYQEVIKFINNCSKVIEISGLCATFIVTDCFFWLVMAIFLVDVASDATMIR